MRMGTEERNDRVRVVLWDMINNYSELTDRRGPVNHAVELTKLLKEAEYKIKDLYAK